MATLVIQIVLSINFRIPYHKLRIGISKQLMHMSTYVYPFDTVYIYI